MSTTATKLFSAQYLPTTTTQLYQSPKNTNAIIDKFTVTNTDGSNAYTITIYIVPNGQSAGNSNIVVYALSVSEGETLDLTELQNHILAPQDSIYASASSANHLVVRGSGREIK